MMQKYQSWGRYPKAHQTAVFMDSAVQNLADVTARNPGLSKTPCLAYGQGRSYGDSCLNHQGFILPTGHQNRILAFDRNRGVLRCEAGVTLDDILQLIVPTGWFLPVSPGTKFVSIGGAIANDVHGKNHHKAGSFGNHVRCLELLRSDGQRLVCSNQKNQDFFQATIGGLGLTGLISWAEIQLKPILNPFISQDIIRFSNVDDFFKLSQDSEQDYEYTVAWIDCLAHGRHVGRGHFIRGNHSPALPKGQTPRAPSIWGKQVFMDIPSGVLNRLTLKIFNTAYYWRLKRKTQTVHYDPFFYPLDSIGHWNRIYGPKGFVQYQCVVPCHLDGQEALKSILGSIAKAKMGSFLAVMKIFGHIPSVGLLSFPRPGITLALDFPLKGERLFALLRHLDGLVLQAGGALYPAKDACMSPQMFRHSYPNFEKFLPYWDQGFSSDFWKRVTQRMSL